MPKDRRSAEHALYLPRHPPQPTWRRNVLTPAWGVLFANTQAAGAGNTLLTLPSASGSMSSGSQRFVGFTGQAVPSLSIPLQRLLSAQQTQSASRELVRCGGEDLMAAAEGQGRAPRGTVSECNTPICFDFAQGRCRRAHCQYSHDWNMIILHNSKEKRICFDYLRGECKRQNLCRFSHNVKPLVKQWLGEAAARGIPEARLFCDKPSGTGICYDFVRGECYRGLNCPWSHNLLEIAFATAQDKEKVIKDQFVQSVTATSRLLELQANSSSVSNQ